MQTYTREQIFGLSWPEESRKRILEVAERIGKVDLNIIIEGLLTAPPNQKVLRRHTFFDMPGKESLYLSIKIDHYFLNDGTVGSNIFCLHVYDDQREARHAEAFEKVLKNPN